MLDIDFIRANRDKVQAAADNKNINVDIGALLELDEKRRELQTKADGLRAERNSLAKRSSGGQPSSQDMAEGKRLKAELADQEKQLEPVMSQYQALF